VQEQYSAIWERDRVDKQELIAKMQDYFREHDNTRLRLVTSPDGVVDAKMVKGW
jgi:hypothetical protein